MGQFENISYNSEFHAQKQSSGYWILPGVSSNLMIAYIIYIYICIRNSSIVALSGFHPFHQAKILGRESSLPSRRYLEATEIRRRRPAVNCDSGWRLSAWVNYAAWYSHLTHIFMNSFFSCNLVLMMCYEESVLMCHETMHHQVVVWIVV